MSSQPLHPVTFKMHTAQRTKFGVYGLLCLCVPVYGIWSMAGSPGEFNVFAAIMVLFIAITLLAPAAFWARILRSRLTFSAEGVFFQGAISSVQMSWGEVKGLADSNGETYLVGELPKNRKRPINIPISWFTRMNLHRTPEQPDEVVGSLKQFAPQLFHI